MSFDGPVRAVIIPGTGSDDVFIRACFRDPLATLGVALVTPSPRPGRGLVEGYRAALDEAADRHGPVLAGGVSLGAHVAARWAAERGAAGCAGLLAVLPAWLGTPGTVGTGGTDDADGTEPPAAVAARASADLVDRLGVHGALDVATEGVPDWLAGQLRRAWPRYGDRLAESLRVAAVYPAPSAAQLTGLTVPSAVVGCVDDPVHPVAVARAWAAALGGGRREITLADLGADLANLGRAAVAAFPSW